MPLESSWDFKRKIIDNVQWKGEISSYVSYLRKAGKAGKAKVTAREREKKKGGAVYKAAQKGGKRQEEGGKKNSESRGWKGG